MGEIEDDTFAVENGGLDEFETKKRKETGEENSAYGMFARLHRVAWFRQYRSLADPTGWLPAGQGGHGRNHLHVHGERDR